MPCISNATDMRLFAAAVVLVSTICSWLVVNVVACESDIFVCVDHPQCDASNHRSFSPEKDASR